ncbi:metallophosphatase domain-containing protein [Zunongwangia endophytica]|uniref:Metallophosphatase domain-containing protein n=1 Tax=Zunongwangia endophytica TaxID=1808945 RepID=A0ABV8H8K5_9FLAO|nr:metallophosphatase domain-containing protein [Zunongwangia endophytica]MDN3596255.1 metallophosphatase domain-containing protein [Zunongwangia endophytica]
MRLVSISDTHNKHEALSIPDADVIVHCGDFTEAGSEKETLDFLEWLSAQPYQHKILIAGNHDFYLEKHQQEISNIIPSNIIYLKDSGINIEGITFWGSPYTPSDVHWAFALERGKMIKEKWDMVPEDTDILITHTPPYSIHDENIEYKNIGCEELLKKVVDIKPKFHLFGHVHDDFGSKKIGPTTFINSSVMDSKYRLMNKISVFEI